MATLAAQLETDYTYIKTEHSIDATEFTRHCVLAAAWAMRYAGDVDSTDNDAVLLGGEYLEYLIEHRLHLLAPDALTQKLEWLRGDAEDLRTQRIQHASTAVILDADGDVPEDDDEEDDD